MGCSSSNPRIMETKPNDNLITDDHLKHKINLENRIFTSKNNNPISSIYTFQNMINKNETTKIYTAKHNSTHTQRSIKEFPKEFHKQLPSEIEILSKLSHQNITKTLEWFEDEKSYFIVTELIEGGTLLKVLGSLNKFTEKDAAEIMQQLFSITSYLFSKKIIFRNFKLDNIMIEKGSQITVKLIDFELAAYFDKGDLCEVIGSPFYMAPEVIQGSYSFEADIWSLGVIMFILLSGEYPFYSSNINEVFNLIKNGEYVFKKNKWFKTSREAQDLITKILNPNPKERPSVETCLNHDWFRLHIKHKQITSEEFADLRVNLCKFLSGNQLVKAFKAYLVYHFEANVNAGSLKLLFKKMDKNGDGRLSYEEVKDGFLTYFNDHDIKNNLDEIVSVMNANDNHYIDYDEFIRVFIDIKKIANEQHLKEAFDFFDIDKSGFISVDELKQILNTDGERNKDVIEKIINDLDTNDDKMISFEEMKEKINSNLD
jgi:calcium-dependent protein kinase